MSEERHATSTDSVRQDGLATARLNLIIGDKIHQMNMENSPKAPYQTVLAMVLAVMPWGQASYWLVECDFCLSRHQTNGVNQSVSQSIN